MDKQADQQCVSNGRAATDEQTDKQTGKRRTSSDGPADRQATGQQTDKRRASRRSSDGPVMDKQTEQRADE